MRFTNKAATFYWNGCYKCSLGTYRHLGCSKPADMRGSYLIAGPAKSKFPVHQGEPSVLLLPPRREGRSQTAATS